MIRFTGLPAILLALFTYGASATVTPLPGATPQTTAIHDWFPNPVAVRVTDHGRPVAGVTVSWWFPYALAYAQEIDARASCFIDAGLNCHTTTGVDGIAVLPRMKLSGAETFAVSLTASSESGKYLGETVIQLAAGMDAPPAAPTLSIVSGNGQRAAEGTQFAEPLVVRVTDADGTPRSNITTYFRADNGDGTPAVFEGSMSSAYAIVRTDENGFARSPAFTAGSSVGAGRARVMIVDPASFHYLGDAFDFVVTDAQGRFSLQDLWWSGSKENGWGMAAIQHDSQLFNLIFAYDAAGGPTWYAMPGGEWFYGVGSDFYGRVYSPRSSPYFAYDASRFSLRDRGGLRLSFNGTSAGRLRGDSWSSGGIDKRLERLDFTGDVPVPLQGIGDLWWGGEAQNGWGISILEQAGGLFCVWFTYDANGDAIWFPMLDGTWTDSSTYSGTIYRTASSSWPVNYDAARFHIGPVGSFTFRFANRDFLEFEYNLEGRTGTHSMQRLDF